MSSIFMLLAVLAGWIILAGCGDALLALSRKAPPHWPKLTYPLARSVSALPLFIVLISLEYTQGLGQFLAPLGAILTIAAFILVQRGWKIADKSERKARITLESIFLIGLLICFVLFWRNPDIADGSERAPDLAHTVAYLRGATLPPPDPWVAGFTENSYYTFQYYSGAWIGRLFNLTPSQTYFADLILAMAWALTALSTAAWMLSHGRRWITYTVAFGILFGASFAPLLLPFTHSQYSLSDGMRFIGGSLGPDSNSLTPFGSTLRNIIDTEATRNKPKATSNTLPIESFAYCTQLGDWHPNIGGFTIFGILLAACAVARARRDPYEQTAGAAVAASTIVALFITNTWITPLGAIVALSFLAPQWIKNPKLRSKELMFFAASGILSTLILYPHIAQLIQNMSNGLPVKFAFIASSEAATRTPFIAWLIIAGPPALFLTLAISGNIKRKPLTKPEITQLENNGFTPKILLLEAALAVGLLLLINETFFVDDTYGGVFERFNTVLKWYPIALLAGTTLALPIALLSRRLPTKIAALATLALATLPSLYEHSKLPFSPYLTQRGDWSGAGWLKARACKDTYFTLLQYPRGVVLEPESANKQAFTPRSLALLTGHNCWLGWPWHQTLWKGNGFKTPQARRQQALDFYEAKMKDPGKWAKENNIDFIVWSPSLTDTTVYGSQEKPKTKPQDYDDTIQTVLEILLNDDYNWMETKPAPKREGLWIRKGFPKK